MMRASIVYLVLIAALLAKCLADQAEFEGRKIVLLGASAGMGRSAGELMVKRGAKVVFVSRTQSKLDKVLEEMGNPSNAFALTADASSVDDIEKVMKKSSELMGGIDGFMYGPTCTGEEGFAPVASLFESGKFVDTHKCQQLYNVENFIESVRLVVPYMKEAGKGSIVVISSIMGQIPSFNAAYGAAKATTDYYVRSFAVYLARYNIRVNSFAAGVHMTEIFSSFGDNKDAIVKDVQWRIPLGRGGTSDEGGEMLAFMLSDRASFMTGEVLVSDGGSMNMRAFTDALSLPEDRLFEPSKAHRDRCEAQL